MDGTFCFEEFRVWKMSLACGLCLRNIATNVSLTLTGVLFGLQGCQWWTKFNREVSVCKFEILFATFAQFEKLLQFSVNVRSCSDLLDEFGCFQRLLENFSFCSN